MSIAYESLSVQKDSSQELLQQRVSLGQREDRTFRLLGSSGFYKSVNRYPPLTCDQQKDLASHILKEECQGKDVFRLREALVFGNLKFIDKKTQENASLYRALGNFRDDFFQEALLGMFNALETYDYEQSSFISWAKYYIKKKRNLFLTKALTFCKVQQPFIVNLLPRLLFLMNGCPFTYQEAFDFLAHSQGLKVKNSFKKLISFLDQKVFTLEELLKHEEELLFGKDPSLPEQVYSLLPAAFEEMFKKAGLDEREKLVLSHRYGLHGKALFLEEICTLVPPKRIVEGKTRITKQMVSLIEQSALRKLRKVAQLPLNHPNHISNPLDDVVELLI